MVAFILAAGYGTRLRPLTFHTPKALVEVGGTPMLELVARRCIEAGARQLVVNVSHLSEQVVAFLEEQEGFGVPFHVSDEPGEPLETGGGIKRAAHLLPDGQPVLVHNVDILTDINLRRLVETHHAADPPSLATLAVVPSTSERYLSFDDLGLLGYGLEAKDHLMRHPIGEPRRFDFCGVQIVSPELIGAIRSEPKDKFSVMDLYLRLARDGASITRFEGPHRCLDVGTHERLAAAEDMLAELEG